MAPLDESPNCELTYASFRLAGDGLVAAEVTTRLGIVPRFAADRWSSIAGVPAGRQRTGVWILSSDDQIASTSVERHLVYLLAALEPRADTLRALRAEQDLDAGIWCYWRSATGHGGPEVSPSTLARIAALDTWLGFDFYGP
jgi:hypothetical protein